MGSTGTRPRSNGCGGLGRVEQGTDNPTGGVGTEPPGASERERERESEQQSRRAVAQQTAREEARDPEEDYNSRQAAVAVPELG